MTTTDEYSNTIKFHDYGEDQEGFIAIRKFGEKVAICLSLQENGDVEAVIEKEKINELLLALQEATTTIR